MIPLDHEFEIRDWYHTGMMSLMAMTVRIDAELEQALASLSDSEHLSRQEVIRRAVLERYHRAGHATEVRQSSSRMRDRWGDVLDRLGDV